MAKKHKRKTTTRTTSGPRKQRPLWSGSITFGLVNVPVKLYPAVRDKDVHFHMVTKDGHCRLRRKLYCPDTGKEFDFHDTARGYEIAPDQYVIMDEAELKSLRPESGRAIEITDFVDLADIDPLYYRTPYYVAPAESGEKPYRLLLEAMIQSKKVGIATFVMREKEYLVAIRPLEHSLCLETMNFADEVVSEDSIPNVPVTSPVQRKEVEVARRLIETLTTQFDPKKYHEHYREQVQALIEKKAAGKKITIEEPEEEEAPRVLSLMKALEESLQEARRHSSRAHSNGQRRRKSA